MANDSRLSELIDEDGQLFGVINVIDALVGLLIISVLVAGIALVGPLSGGDNTETRYVTIDAGTQPEYIATQITEGDQWTPEGSATTLTVEEAFISPQVESDQAGNRRVIIRAAVNGTLIESTAQIDESQLDNTPIQFAGEPLRFGRTFTIETNQYVIEGTVTDVSQNPTRGTQTTQTVNVELTGVTLEEAELLAVGMTEVMGTKETATLTDIQTAPSVETVETDDGLETVERPQRRDLTLTLTLTVRELEDGTVLFRGEQLRPGQQLVLELDDIIVEGQVTAFG